MDVTPPALVAATTAQCIKSEAIASAIAGDQASVGGKTFLLAGGLEQAFADMWRRESDVTPVKVSAVIAHMFKDPASAQILVDVVEFDPRGCALSRTYLSGEEWTHILKDAVGITA